MTRVDQRTVVDENSLFGADPDEAENGGKKMKMEIRGRTVSDFKDLFWSNDE